MTLRALPFACLLFVACACATESTVDAPAPAAGTETVTIADADAADHIGDECVVEMVVRAARALVDKDVCFLNSRKDRDSPANFTAVIFKQGLQRFREQGVENPALHFLDRKIRVRGVIGEHKDRPQIIVEDPAQIEFVEDAEATAPE